MSVDIVSVRRSSPSRPLYAQADPLYTGCRSVNGSRHLRQTIELGMSSCRLLSAWGRSHLERMATLTSSKCNINSLRCWCTRYRDVWFPSGCRHTPDNVSWLLYGSFSPWYRLNVRGWRYRVVSRCSQKTSEVKYCRARYSTKLKRWMSVQT